MLHSKLSWQFVHKFDRAILIVSDELVKVRPQEPHLLLFVVLVLVEPQEYRHSSINNNTIKIKLEPAPEFFWLFTLFSTSLFSFGFLYFIIPRKYSPDHLHSLLPHFDNRLLFLLFVQKNP